MINKRKIIQILLMSISILMLTPLVAYADTMTDGFADGLFQGLYGFLNGLFTGLFTALNNLFGNLFTTISNGFTSLMNFIGSVFTSLWNAISTLLTNLFKPILDLVDGILYLFTQSFTIIVLALKVIASLFGLVISFADGIITTITSFLSWSGSTQYYSLPDPINQGFTSVLGLTGQMGVNILPLVLCVFIWLVTGFSVFRIVGGRS